LEFQKRWIAKWFKNPAPVYLLYASIFGYQFLSVQQAGAGGWSWNGVREKHCYLAGAGGRSWNDVRKKYCTAGAPAEQPNTVKGTK